MMSELLDYMKKKRSSKTGKLLKMKAWKIDLSLGVKHKYLSITCSDVDGGI
jgi:hypothetical protein